MICPQCENQLPDDVKFCKYCGARIGEKSATVVTPDNVQKTPTPASKPAPVKKKNNFNKIKYVIIALLLVIVAVAAAYLFIGDDLFDGNKPEKEKSSAVQKDSDDEKEDNDKNIDDESEDDTDKNSVSEEETEKDEPDEEKTFNFSETAVGEYITFGSYEQDNDTSNGKEPIEWRVLEKYEDKMLVISRYGLDAQAFNAEEAEVTWETCTLRSWLNNDFLNNAFSATEQEKIQLTTVYASPNPNYDKSPGNDTQDKMFLLSVNEATTYFSDDNDRLCIPTEYAKAQGVWTSDGGYFSGRCSWWLRTPGAHLNYVTSVRFDGFLLHYGEEVNLADNPIRPAMWITL